RKSTESVKEKQRPRAQRTRARRAPAELAARSLRADDRGVNENDGAPANATKLSADAVKLSSATRVVYPEAKLTKGDVFAYFDDVTKLMVPALAGRPLALKQWPKGISTSGFYRQN